jgi:hypothetical protein
MNQNLKPNERELIKLITFFKKRAEKLISEEKLGEEHQQMLIACDTLVEKLLILANHRSTVIQERDQLKTIVKDNASCPNCGKNTHLKSSGVKTDENGWKFNKYICRRCNIEFVWNRPNNPWDLVSYMEKLLEQVELEGMDHDDPEAMKEQIRDTIGKLKPVLESSDARYFEMQSNEGEMDRLIHQFKNHLLIEKIKMDSFEGEF